MKEESFDSKKDRRIETDTAREATAESFRTEGWDAFSKDKPIDLLPEENLTQRALSGQEGGDAFLETQMPTTGKRSGLFLSCFDEKQTGQEIKADGENGKNGSFLRVFGFQPIPDGDPIEWDLSQDAVLTQLRTYHEVVHRFRMPLPKRRLRSLNSHVEWHHRTVYLEDLPRDVHPESLRRAFEMMFGEIEEENGIILASARHSSIAYIVFKCLESAHAVGLSDFWIKGSKITIQKYRPPFSDADSIGG